MVSGLPYTSVWYLLKRKPSSHPRLRSTNAWFRRYIYIYIYMCVCVCVCVCGTAQEHYKLYWTNPGSNTPQDKSYGHFPPISKTIQIRWTRLSRHCWRSEDELISDNLLRTPWHGRSSVDRITRNYLQQLCTDTGCSMDDLQGAMDDGEREAGKSLLASVMYSYGPPHMAKQKQDDQIEHIYSSYVRIRDVALKTCQKRRMIGRSGERGSGISVLAARHDDDDIYIYIYIYIYMIGQIH